MHLQGSVLQVVHAAVQGPYNACARFRCRLLTLGVALLEEVCQCHHTPLTCCLCCRESSDAL